MKLEAERLDAHNAAVDTRLIGMGRCGAIHLPTGRRCFLAAQHASSCTFLIVPPEFTEVGVPTGRDGKRVGSPLESPTAAAVPSA